MARRRSSLINKAESGDNNSESLLRGDEFQYTAEMAGFQHTSKASRSGYGPSDVDVSTKTVNGELNNLIKGISPFSHKESSITITNAIGLCQKAYWNVPIFRSTIDIQSQFANSKLYFKGSDDKVLKIFDTWYKKIEGNKVSSWFFTEWFRSGNVFLFRFDGEITVNEYRRITRSAESGTPKTKKIPIKYTLFNPADMVCDSASTFVNSNYSKVLNKYELSRLKTPATPEEKEFVASLPADVQKEIKDGTDKVNFNIPQEQLTAIFCGKQPYEPLAVPMYYPVLTDIDLKLEFKKVEKIIARTVDYAILLVKAGSKERDMLPKGMEMNGRLLNSLTELFQSESVGRVLVSDYTTEAEFIIPDLNKIFGSEKYSVVNTDIANGLMNIFWGEEKFANSMVKIKVFLERLNSARESYLNEFLIPEMNRVAESLGIKNVPTPCFEPVDMDNEIEYLKIYTRLAEIGVLTPEEMFEAFENRNLPLPETSEESQRKFKALKDQELYTPLAPSKQANTEKGGRPAGTKAPQSTKKVAPIGASAENYSVESIKKTVDSIESLRSKAEDVYKAKSGLKRLSKKYKELVFQTCENIVISEPMSNWSESIANYLENPVPNINAQYSKISDVSEEHQIDLLQASILFHSRKE
jgi:hypothetical protein